MIAGELLSHWESESASPARHPYEGRRLLSVDGLEAYAGVDQSGSRRFVAIRLGAAARKSAAARLPRSSNGILVEAVEQGGGSITFFLREQAGIPDGVFPSVMSDVLTATERASPELAVRVVLDRFSSWQAALSRQAGGMSAPEVRGIIGELLVAIELLEPRLGTAAIPQIWRAPDDDHIHDFVGQRWELEVKTALAPATRFHVSAEGQLEPAADNRMFLAAVELEPAADGTSLVGLVKQLLRPDLSGPLAEVTRNALVRRGALDPMLGGEAIQAYRVVAMDLYEVIDGFPLLRRRSLPGGVSALHYEISLAACRQYRIDRDLFLAVLMNMESAQ